MRPAAGAASLENDAWEEDLPADGLYCDSVELQNDYESVHALDASAPYQQCADVVHTDSFEESELQFRCQECLDTMYEPYEDQESDGGGEWIDESVVARKPFLDQFKITTPTSAAAS